MHLLAPLQNWCNRPQYMPCLDHTQGLGWIRLIYTPQCIKAQGSGSQTFYTKYNMIKYLTIQVPSDLDQDQNSTKVGLRV